MAAVTVSETNEGWSGDMKKIVLELSSTPATGDTYDTNMDATDGRAALFREIFDAVYTTVEQRVDCTWSNTTGVVTLGTVATPTVSTGYLTIRGK